MYSFDPILAGMAFYCIAAMMGCCVLVAKPWDNSAHKRAQGMEANLKKNRKSLH